MNGAQALFKALADAGLDISVSLVPAPSGMQLVIATIRN